jgi:hypothetical protein
MRTSLAEMDLFDSNTFELAIQSNAPFDSPNALKPTTTAPSFSFNHCICFAMTSFPVNHILYPNHASSITLAAGTIVDDLMREDIAINAKVVFTHLTCIPPTLAHTLGLPIWLWPILLDLYPAI